MTKQEIEAMALEVQGHSEEVHCASAILALKKMIQERIRKTIHFEARLNALNSQLAKATLEGDEGTCEYLYCQLNELYFEAQFDIYVNYSNDLAEGSARHYIEDRAITIVLPEAFLLAIKNGLLKRPTGAWSDGMLKAKESLGTLTCHELGEIYLDRFGISGSDDERHENAKDFAEELLKLRKQRNRRVHCGATR